MTQDPHSICCVPAVAEAAKQAEGLSLTYLGIGGGLWAPQLYRCRGIPWLGGRPWAMTPLVLPD